MFEVSIPYSFPLPHESLRWFHPARVLALDLTPLHVFAAKTSPTRLTNPFVTYPSSFIIQYASIMPTFRRQIYGHLLIKANISAKIWLIPQKRHSSEIIDWVQVMNSLGSIDDFSYKESRGDITTFFPFARLEDCKIYIHDSLSRHFSLLSHLSRKRSLG